MNKLSAEEKRVALEAGKNGVKVAMEKMEGKGLTWWERLVWAVLAFLAYAGSSFLTGCGTAANLSLSSDQGQVCVSRAADGSMVVSTVPPVVQQRLVK